MIERDVEALKSVFVAEGEGLDPRLVDNTFKLTEDVLMVMELDTNALVSNYKSTAG